MALLNIPPPSTTAVRVSLATRIIRRDAGRCVYCGRKPAALEIDHVTPCAHFPADAPAAVVNDPANS